MILHKITGNVCPRAGHIVVAASLTGIDLKDFITPVPLIILDVEVGKAYVMKIFQERAIPLCQFPVTFGEDDGMIADPVGRVILKQYVYQSHHENFAVPFRVAGEDPHECIVPGDKILNND